jgi:hypothetical protein
MSDLVPEISSKSQTAREARLLRAYLAFIVAILITQSSALRADDAQDAIDLLTATLKCPIKPIRSGSDTSDIFDHWTHNFSGTKSIFRMYSVHKDGEGNTWNLSPEARFADLDWVEIEPASHNPPPYSGPPGLRLHCRGGRDCAKDGVPPAPMAVLDFYVCDGKAADDAKVAIDTLIKLNR